LKNTIREYNLYKNMVKKNIGIIILLIFCLLPIYKTEAKTTNAGFVPENIWYSKDPLLEGDKVQIYTVVFNPDTRQLSGTVIFFDNNVFLGKKDFIVPPKSVKDVSIAWTVTVGTHSIFGKIENSKFLLPDGKYEEIYLADNETNKSVKIVSKIILPQNKNDDTATEPKNNLINNGIETIQNFGTTVLNTIPASISNPIVTASTKLDDLRNEIEIKLGNEKEITNKQIDVLKKAEISKTNKTETNITFTFALHNTDSHDNN